MTRQELLKLIEQGGGLGTAKLTLRGWYHRPVTPTAVGNEIFLGMSDGAEWEYRIREDWVLCNDPDEAVIRQLLADEDSERAYL